MNRFRKLEFEPSAETLSRETQDVASRKPEVDWMKRADDSRRAGQYESALRYYSRALEDDKKIISAWAGQVQMLLMLEEDPEAEIWSRKALELFPSDGELMAARAQALCRLGRTKQAFATIDGALSQPGSSAYRWMVRGELLLAGKQSTQKHCFDKAIEMDEDWLVPVEAALIYLHYNQPSNAQNRARVGVERAPDVAYAWYVVGLCQASLGMHTQAGRSFTTCLELAPGNRDAEDRLQAIRAGGGLWKRLKGLWSK